MRKMFANGVLVAALMISATTAQGQSGVTYNWHEETDVTYGSGFGGGVGIAVDSNNVYIAYGNATGYWCYRKSDGAYITSTYGGGGTQNVLGCCNVAVNDTYIYVVDTGGQTPQYGAVWMWQHGNPDRYRVIGGLRDAHGIDLDETNLYVAVTGDHKINVYTLDGGLVRTWGSFGSLLEQFNNPADVAVDERYAYVSDRGNNLIKVFTKTGEYVWSWYAPAPRYIDVDDRFLYATQSGSKVMVYDKRTGVLIREFATTAHGICVDGDYLYIGRGTCSRFFGPAYRTLGELSFNALPWTSVTSVVQRAGTTVLDIDYLVGDPDSANLTIYAGAHVNGSNDFPHLDSFVPMRTFLEESATNTGSGVAVGESHHLVWDAGADGLTSKVSDYGNLQVCVMAKDDRDLIDLHFITVPEVGGNPSFLINRVPLTQTDFMPAWLWLLGSGDSALSFADGTVTGTTSPYDGQVLAQGTNTTADGMAFVFERLGVRQATTEELDRAREGSTPGSVLTWDPLRAPPPAGSKVNEINFVTDPTDGIWVVPLP